MKNNYILNNKAVQVECDAQDTLFSLLRKLHIKSTKYGCKNGVCDSCYVLLNKKQVPSCQIPVASVQNQTIETLEHFSLSNEYADIIHGLEKANATLCGYCDSGKIFTIHTIIDSENYPNRNEIITKMKNFTCQCTTIETIIDAIYKAYDIRYERIGKDIYGRK